MRNGPRLSTDQCDALYRGACGLYQKSRSEGRFRSDTCEGIISTRGKTVMLGGIAGVQFDAVIELDGGTTTTRFLVNARDLASGGHQDLQWFSIIGIWPAEDDDVDEDLDVN